MAKFAAKDSNKNITLSPHGTGKVVVGTGAADATVQSDGNHNLVLQTGNSTTGSISITDGANGDIALSPNGTGTVVVNTDLDVDNININSNSIAATNTDGNVEVSPNGTGKIVVGTGSAVATIQSDGNQNLKLQTGNSTTGSITLADGADGDISVSPNGTGQLIVGSGSGTGTISSASTQDLVLQTNEGTNSGTISIVDGANGNINITPNGTGRTVITNANLTQPQLTTQINDSNANALIKVTATTNAVNEISIANAAASGVPSISSTGDDSSVNLLLDCKGNGEIDFGANTKFASKTDAKIQLPSAGGVYESDGSTEILTESSGAVTLKNTAIDSSNNITFPDGHILQVQYAELTYPVGTTNTTDTETGLQCSITPSSATNYIYAEFHASGSNAQTTHGVRFNLKVEGGGTDGTIGKGTGGPGGLNNRTSAFKCIAGGPLANGAHGTHRWSARVRFRCNETVPNWSSGALTVKLMFSSNSSSYQARLNFAEGADNTTYSANSSQLILTEVKG